MTEEEGEGGKGEGDSGLVGSDKAIYMRSYQLAIMSYQLEQAKRGGPTRSRMFYNFSEQDCVLDSETLFFVFLITQAGHSPVS